VNKLEDKNQPKTEISQKQTSANDKLGENLTRQKSARHKPQKTNPKTKTSQDKNQPPTKISHRQTW